MMQLRFEKRLVSHVPWGLLLFAMLVAALGVWNLASAARSAPDGGAALTVAASRAVNLPTWGIQGVFFCIGLLSVVGIALLDYRFIQRMAIPIYLLNLLALIALRFIGHKAKGAESWFAIGPVRIQPAEFVKIGMILMLARFYHDDYRPNQPAYGWRLWRPALIMAVPTVLVLVQPDLGTAMMLGLSGVTIILFGHVNKWVVGGMALGLLLASGIIWNDFVRSSATNRADGRVGTTIISHRLKPHQRDRIASWLDPESDLRGKNYHSAQSKIAVGSGGLTGVGWREGTQTGLSFLPEQHTDFIFSVWAEEHGFISCVLLLILYGGILLFSLGVAFNSRDRFGTFVAVGVAAMIFWQVFENIGMVTGLLPVTGITLPLMSYGGSSILSVMMSLGLLVNVSLRRHIF